MFSSFPRYGEGNKETLITLSARKKLIRKIQLLACGRGEKKQVLIASCCENNEQHPLLKQTFICLSSQRASSSFVYLFVFLFPCFLLRFSNTRFLADLVFYRGFTQTRDSHHLAPRSKDHSQSRDQVRQRKAQSRSIDWQLRVGNFTKMESLRRQNYSIV